MNKADHPLYCTWTDMKKRCKSEKHKAWKDYGGRGISVCQRWSEGFWDFVADVGTRPEGMTLDRINNDGNYEPSNCRWASRSQQQHNNRRTKLSEAGVREIRATKGVKSAQRLAAKYGTTPGHVMNVRSGISWRGVQP